MAIKDKYWFFCFALIHTVFLRVTFVNDYYVLTGRRINFILWRTLLRRNRQVWYVQGNVLYKLYVFSYIIQINWQTSIASAYFLFQIIQLKLVLYLENNE